ncbi:MAG: SCP2 sterol-binding domain-containing protein [Sphingorhabdus sp.]|jgi:putative sterol carrier protein|uniref:SCP2 sterol-binding domain-containing protein n=1 Tax=Sphingorhabdus sp. TaxID=1902408 RepID=UPI0025D05664|nr:SCP2 sterol-binding domain-containing protein [Sphingorhabdus sp.]MCO4092238.1 SCP2 sterol-binding domain-containing protein [Sphingorhabdus sp.]
MSVDAMVHEMASNNAWVSDARILLDFGTDGFIMLDGIDQQVHFGTQGKPADTVITTAWADWLALINGSLDPMRAINRKQVQITGNMDNVAKLIALGHRLF